jgi:hypothetical protein
MVRNHPSGDPSPSERICASPGEFSKAAESCNSIWSITSSSVCRLPAAAAISVSRKVASFLDAAGPFLKRCFLSMRFNRYPKGEAYQVTQRKPAAARRAVHREKDRYPCFFNLQLPACRQVRLTDASPGVALYLNRRQGRLGVRTRNGILGTVRSSVSWLKIKARLQQEFAVGGFTQGKGSRKQLGALFAGSVPKRNAALFWALKSRV